MSTQNMTAAEANANIYLGKTKLIPRPSADDRRFAGFPDTLARQQAAWDKAKTWDDRNAQLQAERHVEVETKRLAEIEQSRANARADLEARLKREYLSKPAATESDWEAAKAGIVAQALVDMPSPVEQARAELLRSGRYPVL